MARVAIACLIGALIAGGVAIWILPPASSPFQQVVRLSVTLPDDARLVNGAFPALVLSPRGTHLVYVAEHAGDTRLYLRRLDTFAIRPIPGTEGAMSPFFSPDGQWVAFGAEGKLKKVSIAGGQPIVLADAAVLLGGTWGEDDAIVFAGTDVGMSRVSSAGGPVTVATTLDARAREGGHLWPELLPDGKSMLLTVGITGTNMERARIVLHSLSSGTRRTLIEGGTNPHYVASGHIVYSTADSLMAAPFDLATGTVTGTQCPCAGWCRAVRARCRAGCRVRFRTTRLRVRRSTETQSGAGLGGPQGYGHSIPAPATPVLVAASLARWPAYRRRHRGPHTRRVGVGGRA